MRVYISGYLSVLELDNLQQLYTEKGVSIVACFDEDTIKRVELLRGCDAIYFVNGWGNSMYSLLELSIAELKGIEIRYQDEKEKGRA